MIVHIENQTQNVIPLKDTAIKKTIVKTLECADWVSGEPYEISIIFVDRDEIRQINKDYRNIDRATDVISFSYREGEGAEFAGMMLGDLAICPEVVEKHSLTYKTAFNVEMSFVIVHGVLHLLGFDHTKKTDREKMREMEDKVMRELFKDWKGRLED
jgi:probable rRNA maturation factor